MYTHTTQSYTTGACVYPVEWSVISCFRVFLPSVGWCQVCPFLPVLSAVAHGGCQRVRLPVILVREDTFIQLVVYSARSLNWVFTKNIK